MVWTPTPDVNVAAVLDPIGGELGVAKFLRTPAGNREHVEIPSELRHLNHVGVEGTGSYPAGLSRYLRSSGVEVVEFDRPNRQSRRRTGKSDPVEAIEAARAALSRRAQSEGRSRDGNVEAIKALVVASARRVRGGSRRLIRCAISASRLQKRSGHACRGSRASTLAQ